MPEFIISTEYDGRRLKLYPKTCEFCGGVVYVPKSKLKRRKYCSHKCASGARVNKIRVECAYCGKSVEKTLFNVKTSSHGIFFCCREHKDLGQRLEHGIRAIHPPHYGTGKHSYRVIAFRAYPSKCARCGYAEVTEILQVHHIDRDRDNNRSSNLIILCPTCHSLMTRGYLELDAERRFAWTSSLIATRVVSS